MGKKGNRKVKNSLVSLKKEEPLDQSSPLKFACILSRFNYPAFKKSTAAVGTEWAGMLMSRRSETGSESFAAFKVRKDFASLEIFVWGCSSNAQSLLCRFEIWSWSVSIVSAFSLKLFGIFWHSFASPTLEMFRRIFFFSSRQPRLSTRHAY